MAQDPVPPMLWPVRLTRSESMAQLASTREISFINASARSVQPLQLSGS